MSQLAAYADPSRAVSMEVAPFQDSKHASLSVRMENGDTMTLTCSAEELVSLRDKLQGHLQALRAEEWASHDYEDEFNDNAAGS